MTETMVSALGYTFAVGCAVLFAASLWIPYPMLRAIGSPPPSGWEYARSAVLAASTMFRFGVPDFMTSTSFWGGFGWLETGLSLKLVAVLAGASGIALVTLLWCVARMTLARSLIYVVAGLIGFVLSVAAYAIAVVGATPADLHGRYLSGLYLSLLVIAWSVVAQIVQSSTASFANRVTAAFAFACLVVHVYSLTTTLSRYF